MNEDAKQESVHIHSRADELIACLEGEIAKRDARIVELELTVFQLNNSVTSHHWENTALRAELAAIKAQEPIAWYTEDHLDDKSATTYSWTVAERWVEKGWPVSPLYAAPVSEAKAQDTVGEVVGWYRLDRPYEMTSYPSVCATWHKLGAPVAPLYAAPAAPAADAGLSLVEWAKDAVEWGGALNYAAWEFINECPEKSALLFNNTKGPLRAAIMKYAELVAASAKEPSHD